MELYPRCGVTRNQMSLNSYNCNPKGAESTMMTERGDALTSPTPRFKQLSPQGAKGLR